MISRSHTTALAITALVVIAGLAGCTATGMETTSDTSGPIPGSSAGVVLDPLSEYLDPEQTADDSRIKKSEQVIKECMEEQGFEYTMVEPTSDGNGEDQKTAPSREWVKQHGHGGVENTFRGVDASEQARVSDPNSAYVDGLPAAEADTYYAAMFGDPESTFDSQTPDGRDAGCVAKANHDVPLIAQGTVPPIVDETREFRNSLRSDPRIVAIDKEWATSMAQSGYPGRTQRLDDDGGDLAKEVTEYASAHPQATLDDPKVAKMHAAEIAWALADWDCADQMHYEKRIYATLADLEKDYIAEHKGELEEAKLWLSQ